MNDEEMPVFALGKQRAVGDTASMNTPFILWQCHLCGFLYDESAGMPSEGFAPGTRWADIPDSWSCPDCGYAKADFEMQQVAAC